jgi:metal-dependent amidase/aminoacylase/carboxypeptidase family protein
MPTLSDRVEALVPRMRELRRDLHRHPELGFAETRTAGLLAARLRQLGYEVRTGLGQTGVTGLLRGARPGKTLLVRSEIDALPIREAVDVPWKSVNDGVMHA